MIKFFRNIRKKLLQEGKTTHYLKYAIGEILLVVIGILKICPVRDNLLVAAYDNKNQRAFRYAISCT